MAGLSFKYELRRGVKNGTPEKSPEGGGTVYLRFGAEGMQRVYGRDKFWNEQARHQRSNDSLTQ